MHVLAKCEDAKYLAMALTKKGERITRKRFKELIAETVILAFVSLRSPPSKQLAERSR